MKRTSRSAKARPERYTCSAANGSPDAFSGMQIASANAESESVGGCEAVMSGNSQIVLPFCLGLRGEAPAERNVHGRGLGHDDLRAPGLPGRG